MGLTTGDVLQNRYRVVSPLGHGGMGAVYHAWDTRLKIPVALKEMTPQPGLDQAMLAQLRQQFEQEAATLARLNHPHLVRVIDFFEERGNTYLVMDFVEGENLDNCIEREKALPESQVLAWANQLLDALAYCHEQGVIHRDIKPQNVIIRSDGRAVLVDFGLVKLWDPSDPHTRTAMRGMGTPEYAPPEQYGTRPGHTDPRSDLYGLGATIYHALTGQAPMTANDRMAFPSQFVPAQELNPRVGSQTGEAVTQAMELAVNNRFSTANEMAAALGKGEPAPRISAPSPSKPKRKPTKVLPGAQPAVASPRARLSRRQILYGALAAGGLVAGCSAAAAIAALVSQTGDKSSPAPTDKATATNRPTSEPQPAATATKSPTATPRLTETPVEPVPIRWFVGLGTGTNEEQIPAQEEWVADFSARQSQIELTVDFVENTVAVDTLHTQIAAGDPPDIVGPVGVLGSNELYGLWLDLEDYLKDYDLSDFSQGAIDAWQMPDQGMIGLPIGVYPSALYINRDLFDEAGLDYPPQDYASSGWWTIDALEEAARVLTVDAYGNDATSGYLDPDNIVQFGYTHQWSEPRGWSTFFGAGSFVAEDGRTAQCPDHWREAFWWYYRGMWEGYFAPNGFYQYDIFGGNSFNSGSVAMAHCHLWYICCVENVPNWDYAIIPAYNGTHTAKIHTDMVGALNESEHLEAAVETIYAIATSPELHETWGALPALTSLQDDYLASLDDSFPQSVNWDTILAGLNHIDVPNHEGWMPNFSEARERIKDPFQPDLENTAGLNVDAKIDELIADLQTIFDAAD